MFGAKESSVGRDTPRPLTLTHLLWLLPTTFALHEAEEWNIVPWFQTHFTPQTELTSAGARTLLVAFSLASFLYTAAASRLPSIRLTLFAVLPLFILAGVGNALTHIYWALHFASYAPGVATAALLVIPATLYVSARAVREAAIPLWFVGALYALALAPLVAVARAGSTLTPDQLALHRLGARLGQWLWGAG